MKLKRIISAVLAAALFAVTSGCGGANPAEAGMNASAERLVYLVEGVESELVTELTELVEWQTGKVGELLAKREEYAARGEVYQAPDVSE